MKIWKIRLERQRVRTQMPFSLFYLCAGDRVEELRSRFETFLAFPVRHADKLPWTKLTVREVNGEAKTILLGELVSDLTEREANWHAVIPILSLTRNKNSQHHAELHGEKASSAMDLHGMLELYQESDPSNESVKPAFLTDRAWKNWKAQAGTPQPNNRAFPPTTYFVTRDEIFLPPCMACPRLGYHEAGECFLGDPECFKALGRHRADARMFKKLREYDDIKEELSGVREDEGRSTDVGDDESSLPSSSG